MSGEELQLVKEAFDSNYIAPVGPMIDSFEREFSEYTKIPHCLCLSSGTAAMHLALLGVGVGAGDLVLASTLTFIGSVSPATFLGAELVFIDSDEDSWNMSPSLLAEEIKRCVDSGRIPKAVVPTDLYGQCADLEQILAVCEPYGIPVISDAAEAVGATYKGQSAGYHARAAVFSFNGNKIITSSGGGILASHDKEFIDRARYLSTQARDPVIHFEHQEIGFNYRMSNVVAAIGLGQLRALDTRVEQTRAVFKRYEESLSGLPGLTMMSEMETGKCNRWLTVILVDEAQFGASPEAIRLALDAENIEARPVWKPMHMQPVFKGTRCVGGEVSERYFSTGLCLPSGSEMTGSDLDRVCSMIKACRKPA